MDWGGQNYSAVVHANIVAARQRRDALLATHGEALIDALIISREWIDSELCGRGHSTVCTQLTDLLDALEREAGGV